MQKEYLVQDDTEYRGKMRELTEEDAPLIKMLTDEFGEEFRDGKDVWEKLRKWRKEHGVTN